MLNLNEYQRRATRTAVYPERNTGSQIALSYCALGLGNEAGEVQGKVKKLLRGDEASMAADYRLRIADEIGDVLWYAAQLAHELGVTLEEVAQMNLDKLGARFDNGTIKGDGDQR